MTCKAPWAVAFLLCTQTVVCSGDMDTWRKSTAIKRRTPGLVRFYTFAEGTGLATSNLLSDAAFDSLLIAGNDFFLAQDEDCPRWVGGRWPGKPALSIGSRTRSIGRTHFYGVDGTNFTVEMWVRTTNGTAGAGPVCFASVGDGYSEGWRLNSRGRAVEFVLGRKPGQGKGEGMVAVQADGCLRPHLWQQLVAVLNDTNLQLYVDGKLAAGKSFDGIYRHLDTPVGRYRTPEIDFGGLQLGATATHASPSRFDVDELAIFARALNAAEVAQLHACGAPATDLEEQVRQHQAELARQTLLDGIRIELSKEAFGYFPNDAAIPVRVSINAAAAPLFDGRATVDFEIARFPAGELARESRTVELVRDKAGWIEYRIAADRCGLYVLSVTVRDRGGEVLKTARINFARRLPLPPRSEIPSTSVLAAYGSFDTSEMPSLGITLQRTIQPIFGRTQDGTPNYRLSDAYVEKCERLGLQPLYCTQIGFWDGHYPTVADWKKDPGFHQEHLRNLATRYKGRVKYWEIFNEPNCGSHIFQEMTPQIYVQMLKEAHRIIKEIDPEAQIVGPCGTYQYHTWTESVLAAGGGAFLDILSFHNYIDMTPLENYRFGRLRTVKESLLKHLGRLLPLWNTECGIHQPARIDGRPATDEQLLEMYGERAVRTGNGAVKVGVDGISMVNEHRSACWQVQSILVEMAEGVEKYCAFGNARPSSPYGFFSLGDQSVTEKGVALAAMQAVTISAVSARFLPTGLDGAAAISVTDRGGATTVVCFADRPIVQIFKADSIGGVGIKGMDFLGNPLTFTTEAGGYLRVPSSEEPVYLLQVPESFAFSAEKTRTLSRSQPGDPEAGDAGSPIRTMAGTFVPDLDPAKWESIPEQTGGTHDKVVIGRPVPDTESPTFWRGPDDLSFTAKTAWTASGIHFRVAVRDDVLRPARDAQEAQTAYVFDCVELFVDCRPAGSRGAPYYSAGAVQFIVVPQNGVRAAPCPVQPVGNDAPPVTVTCLGRRTDGGYVVEGTLKPVDGGPLRMEAGARINLDFVVDDNDDQPGRPPLGRRVQMALHGRADNCSNTAAWGRYELRPAGE